MKANIPNLQAEGITSSKSTPSMELEGVYLRAMQDISARLMEALPAEEFQHHQFFGAQPSSQSNSHIHT